ncbi:hypothetical protein [Actinoallomurus sp. NPDC050550]|uniref:hypothetical protein n=1 Tax=Actinoallomurus sp. NPDC050550 TaxID=3154937 RepID=UPI0033D55931
MSPAGEALFKRADVITLGAPTRYGLPGYGDPIQFQAGNPYGASHTSNNGEDLPGDVERAAIEFQARRTVEVADTFLRGRSQA